MKELSDMIYSNVFVSDFKIYIITMFYILLFKTLASRFIKIFLGIIVIILSSYHNTNTINLKSIFFPLNSYLHPFFTSPLLIF